MKQASASVAGELEDSLASVLTDISPKKANDANAVAETDIIQDIDVSAIHALLGHAFSLQGYEEGYVEKRTLAHCPCSSPKTNS